MSTEPKWRVDAGILGFAMFEPIAIAPDDLEDCGIFDAEERMLVSFFVTSHDARDRSTDGTAAFTIEILYEPIANDDMRSLAAELEADGFADDVCERLRLAIYESYGSARRELFPAGASDVAQVSAVAADAN